MQEVQKAAMKKRPEGEAALMAELEKGMRQLQKEFPKWAQKLRANGMLWISWPKKASGVTTDLTENIVRQIGLDAGLVDVKVCAVNDVWSGLKFVYRLKDRA